MKKEELPTIPLSRYACGNCKLRGKECPLPGGGEDPTKLACFWLGRNYGDKGFEPRRLRE